MKILVAVPVYNEEKYVTKVLREIRKYARVAGTGTGGVRVLVVNDGSTDGTAQVLTDLHQRGHIDLITHPENRGYGQSLIDAFAWATRHGYDWVITMDCDEQHEPCRIPCFVEACQRDDADIISGSRYLSPELQADQPPVDRRSINRVITDLLNSTLDLNVAPPLLSADPCGSITPTSPAMEGQSDILTDSFCGFKAHRVAALQTLHLSIPGYAFPMQFWVQAAKLRIREIPVKLIYKDATRHFGGMLDDPSARLQHYLEVLTAELVRVRQTVVLSPAPPPAGANVTACACCGECD